MTNILLAAETKTNDLMLQKAANLEVDLTDAKALIAELKAKVSDWETALGTTEQKSRQKNYFC